MKISGYKINLKPAIKEIKEKNYKKVALQLPEGLKPSATKILHYLENSTKADFLISADFCYGACDVLPYEFKNFDVEFTIQIGHTPIPNLKNLPIPTMFINAFSQIDIKDIIEKVADKLQDKKVGIVTTAQHVDALEKIKNVLEENNVETVVDKGNDRIAKEGQILGCNFTAAENISDKVDIFLFVGSGNFHPLGVTLSTGKEVITVDPFTKKIRKKEIEELKENILRQRYGAIASSKGAKLFGILVGIKKGQQRFNLAQEIKDKLEKKGKKSYILVLNDFSPNVLEGFREIDCFVSTACPRIAVDEYIRYKAPIITPVELDILLGLKKWENYEFDELM